MDVGAGRVGDMFAESYDNRVCTTWRIKGRVASDCEVKANGMSHTLCATISSDDKTCCWRLT